MARSSVADQYHDPSFRVLAQRILEVPQAEPFIKGASLDIEEHAALPDSAFAWEDQRLFPLHTPEQAALSYLYATSKEASAPPVVISTLQDALRSYGVMLEIPLAKEASATDNADDYLLPEQKRWSVTDAETIKLAEYSLHNYGKELSLEERVTAATRLVKKAEALQVGGLSLDTHALAGNTICDVDTVKDWLHVRAQMTTEPFQGAYTKIASDLEQVAAVSHDRTSLVKLATAIYNLDKVSGLDGRYGFKLPDPMKTVFNTSKLAEPMIDMGGHQVSLSKLASLPTTLFADVFGNEIVPEITSNSRLDHQKLAEVLPTMPMDLKQAFYKHAKAYIR